MKRAALRARRHAARLADRYADEVIRRAKLKNRAFGRNV